MIPLIIPAMVLITILINDFKQHRKIKNQVVDVIETNVCLNEINNDKQDNFQEDEIEVEEIIEIAESDIQKNNLNYHDNNKFNELNEELQNNSVSFIEKDSHLTAVCNDNLHKSKDAIQKESSLIAINNNNNKQNDLEKEVIVVNSEPSDKIDFDITKLN